MFIIYFALWEGKHNGMKVVEEYCWVITHGLGMPCCGRSGSSELGLQLQLESLVYTHTVYAIVTGTKFDLPQTFQNVTTAQVEECQCKRKRGLFINSSHFQSVVHSSPIKQESRQCFVTLVIILWSTT